MFTPAELTIGLAVVAISAAVQGSIGFGFAVLSVPTLTLVNADFTPIPMLFLAWVIAIAGLVRERGDLDTSGLGWIVTGRVPGALLGAWVLGVVSERALGVVIGVIVLAAIGALASGARIELTSRSRLVAGLVSGFSGTASAIGGPPIALLYRNETGPTVRSTLGAIFTIGIAINVTVLGATGVLQTSDLTTALILSPAMAAGFAASSWVKRHVDGPRLRTAILVISTIAALALLGRSLFG